MFEQYYAAGKLATQECLKWSKMKMSRLNSRNEPVRLKNIRLGIQGIDRSLMFICVHFHCRFFSTDMKESEASHIARLPKVSKDVSIFQDIYIYIYIIPISQTVVTATSLATVNCTAVYSTPSDYHALNISCLLVFRKHICVLAVTCSCMSWTVSENNHYLECLPIFQIQARRKLLEYLGLSLDFSYDESLRSDIHCNLLYDSYVYSVDKGFSWRDVCIAVQLTQSLLTHMLGEW